MDSLGRRRTISWTTVRPPTPESNTPMGASALIAWSAKWYVDLKLCTARTARNGVDGCTEVSQVGGHKGVHAAGEGPDNRVGDPVLTLAFARVDETPNPFDRWCTVDRSIEDERIRQNSRQRRVLFHQQMQRVASGGNVTVFDFPRLAEPGHSLEHHIGTGGLQGKERPAPQICAHTCLPPSWNQKRSVERGAGRQPASGVG